MHDVFSTVYKALADICRAMIAHLVTKFDQHADVALRKILAEVGMPWVHRLFRSPRSSTRSLKMVRPTSLGSIRSLSAY